MRHRRKLLKKLIRGPEDPIYPIASMRGSLSPWKSRKLPKPKYYKRKQRRENLLKIYNLFEDLLSKNEFVLEEDIDVIVKCLKGCWLYDETMDRTVLARGNENIVLSAVVEVEDHRDHHGEGEVNMACCYRISVQPYKDGEKLKSIGVITPTEYEQKSVDDGLDHVVKCLSEQGIAIGRERDFQ